MKLKLYHWIEYESQDESEPRLIAVDDDDGDCTELVAAMLENGDIRLCAGDTLKIERVEE